MESYGDPRMSVLEPRQLCEIISVADDNRFVDFIQSHPSGLAVIAEPYGDDNMLAVPSDAGDFVKWAKQNNPTLQIVMPETKRQILRQSVETWLPLVFLAMDTDLSDYLKLVVGYLEYKLKSALKGEVARVHLNAEYKTKEGEVKRFSYDGDSETLKAVVKKMDLNQFLDD
jgi:hypothetical protein